MKESKDLNTMQVNPDTSLLLAVYSDEGLEYKNRSFYIDERPLQVSFESDKEIYFFEYLQGKRYVIGSHPSQERSDGVKLEELINRSSNAFFWLKKPIPTFEGARGCYIRKELVARLKELVSQNEIFSGLRVEDEARGKNVLVGFGTIDVIQSKLETWYELVKNSLDEKLADHLRNNTGTVDVNKEIHWLFYLAVSSPIKHEQVLIRKLLVIAPNDQELVSHCNFMKLLYQTYQENSSCTHRLDSPEMITLAVEELRTKLTT